jgi:hypothetical protein
MIHGMDIAAFGPGKPVDLGRYAQNQDPWRSAIGTPLVDFLFEKIKIGIPGAKRSSDLTPVVRYVCPMSSCYTHLLFVTSTNIALICFFGQLQRNGGVNQLE